MVSNADRPWIVVLKPNATGFTNDQCESWTQDGETLPITYSLNAVDSSGNIIPNYYYQGGNSNNALLTSITSALQPDPQQFAGGGYGNLTQNQQQVVEFLLNNPQDSAGMYLTQRDFMQGEILCKH